VNLKGKVALVTGGAVRIGRHIAEALADRGADVVVHYRRSGAEARELKQQLVAKGVRCFLVRAALDSERACEQVMWSAVKQAGRVDILVNNAASFGRGRIGNLTTGMLLAELWPNLFAPLFLLREFAKVCRRGKAINILDRRIAGHDTSRVPYVLSKQALAEATWLAALELAPRIAVNGVAPGPVLPPPGKPGSYLKERAGRIPLGKSCPPRDIAAAVISLLENDSITGQIVFVDGGQHLLGEGV
jgi:pteridine reductase